MNKKIGIIGCGSWGLALALALNKSNNKVLIYMNSLESYNQLDKTRISKYLPIKKIPRNIEISMSYKNIINCDYIFLVTPSQSLRQNLQNLVKYNLKKNKFIICSKGIEKKTNKLMSEVLSEYISNPKIFILSGPNFASEVANNLPTAFVLSSSDKNELVKLGNAISSQNFRPYYNNDIIGTQIGGSMKNVIAIACGIVIGKKLGENAKSSILTRGLKEMIALGKSMGGKRKTFYGLSGIGDLSLSCNSIISRNTKLGINLGKGINLRSILKNNFLAEGLNSCESICNLAKKNDVDLPICFAIKDILDGKCINNVISGLLSRPNQYEN